MSGDFDLGDILKNAAFAAATSYLAQSINLKAAGDITGASEKVIKAKELTGVAKALDKKFSVLGGSWGKGFNTGIFSNSATAQLTAASVLEGAFDGAINSALSSAVYGTDFKAGLRNSVVRNIVALGLADAQTKIGGIFNDAQGNPINGGEGSFGHIALHAIAGCAAAEATGADCGAGAAGAVVQAIYAGALEGGTNLNDIEQRRNAKLLGAVVGYIFSGGKAQNVSLASSIAESGLANNRQLHRDEITLIEENAEGFARQSGLCGESDICTSEDINTARNALALQAGRQVDDLLAAGTTENADARAYLESIAPTGYIPGTAGNGFYVDENQAWFKATEDQYTNNLINLETVAANPDIYKFFPNVQAAQDGNIDVFLTTLSITQAEDDAGILSPAARVTAAQTMLTAFYSYLDSQPEGARETIVLGYGQLAQAAIRHTLMGMSDAEWAELTPEQQDYAINTIIGSFVSTLGTLPGGSAAPAAKIRLPGGKTLNLTRTPIGSYRIRTSHAANSQTLITHNTTPVRQSTVIKGGHNERSFNALAANDPRINVGNITQVAPGIKSIKYTITKADGSVSTVRTKTVYDPNVYNDQQIADMSLTAISQAPAPPGNLNRSTTVVGGLEFTVTRNQIGVVTNAFVSGAN